MSETLEHFRVVLSADVYKRGIRAATLTRDTLGISFQYLREYLDLGGVPVATTLPLSDQPVRTPAGAVPAFFAGLLPEGRRLSSLRRAVKTSADDELSLLLAVGRDTVRDVQVVPEGDMPTPSEPLLRVGTDWSDVRLSEVLARRTSTALHSRVHKTRSPPE
jgi:serine/threonine-protein kinase HipA